MSDFSHLTMPISTSARINYMLRQLAVGVALLPGAAKLSRKVRNSEKAHRLTQALKEASLMQDRPDVLFRQGFFQDSELKEIECGAHYRDELMLGDWQKQHTESGDLYEAVIPRMAELIRRHNVEDVIDYGAAYAHIDSELAKQFPGTQFTGVGRSARAKSFNEQYFKLPNLQFESADISEVLARRQWNKTVLTHNRTVSRMLPAFVGRFYRQVAQSGIEHIVLAEQCGLSWETGESYEFSLEPKPSVALRSHMYIHNYPALLAEAGYRVTFSTLLKTRHPDPNFRLVIIEASK